MGYYRSSRTVYTFRSLYCIYQLLPKNPLYCNDHTITEFGIIDSKNSSTAYVILYELIDTWFLDSNRRVGVWLLPWRWHIHNYGVWNYWQQKLIYCICYTIWFDWHMIFGLEQEGGSLIAPMALAHTLHPIDNRSRNRRRNPWVGWCVSSWRPLFPSGSSALIYLSLYICILNEFCYRTYIYTYNRSVIQYWWSCTPSHSIGLYFWGVRSSWVECHFLLSLVYQLCLALWW